MIATGFSKEEVSIDRLRCHIDTLAGERHPLTSPETLERAADYITETFTALDYDVTEHRFTDNSRQYRNHDSVHVKVQMANHVTLITRREHAQAVIEAIRIVLERGMCRWRRRKT